MTQEPTPGLLRLLAAMFYDLILLLGLLLLATTVVVVPLKIGLDSTALEGNPLFQLYLVAVIALFYGWFCALALVPARCPATTLIGYPDCLLVSPPPTPA